MKESPSWLPQGYTLDECDTDMVVLRRFDGSSVATFSASGATRESIREVAEEDYRQRALPLREIPSPYESNLRS